MSEVRLCFTNSVIKKLHWKFDFFAEFRVLNLNPTKDADFVRRRRATAQNLTDHRCVVEAHFTYEYLYNVWLLYCFRFKKMSVRQKWGNVWPGPKTFHPSSVPLPLRQGYLEPQDNKRPAPDKFANAELMKIPNFLHLTPPAIKQQCEAIKKYCTQWPAGLETDEKCEKHFPIEFISSDYCHGLPTIRNPLSRIITLRVSFFLQSPLSLISII